MVDDEMEVEVEVIGKKCAGEDIETPVHFHQQTKIFIADLKSESEHNGLENSDLKIDNIEPVYENRKEEEDLKVNDLAIVERKTDV